MSFKYTRLPRFLKTTNDKKRQEKRFRIDDKIELTLQITNLLEGEFVLLLQQPNFRLADDLIIREETYEALKMEMLNIRYRIHCSKLKQMEAENDLANSFEFNDGVTVLVRQNVNGQVVVVFLNTQKRFQQVIFNENQFSIFENMIRKNIIDGGISNLLKSNE